MRAKEELPECPVATAVSLIGGKWKLLILRNLKERPWRFNELQRSIDGISQKVLTDSLRQMMSDGLAYRHDYHEQPPRVEYGLTELGTKMLPIVNSLADFGNYYKSIIEQNQVRQYFEKLEQFQLFETEKSEVVVKEVYNGVLDFYVDYGFASIYDDWFWKIFYEKGSKGNKFIFGYRTSMSMKNKDTWEFAHKYCGKVWYVCGMVNVADNSNLQCFQ